MSGGRVEIREEDPASEVARRCLESYFEELSARSNGRFDATTTISAEPDELVSPRGHFLVAVLDGEVVGCGAVKHHAGEATEIKRMWVAPAARGLGVGRRMLVELERLAVASGATVAHLETNASLVEAIAMYRKAGYREVLPFNDEPFADHWFEKRLA